MEALMRATETIKSIRVRPRLASINPFRSRQSTHAYDLSLGSILQETRLSALRPPSEFFDHTRISRPADLNQATHVRNPAPFSPLASQRSSRMNARLSFRLNSAYRTTLATSQVRNYSLIVILLAVYALLTNIQLIFAVLFLVGGFAAINRFGTDPIQVGEHTITQKSLYTGLFVIGIPLLWFASPFGTFFWLVGASSVLILGHACMIEPGIESEYATVQDSV
ncbi:hypothetical protein BN946_scf184656.g7 [Trametes cinnabarina]|uniref:PRA1 family protein n=1 Tax=Pycnoporus cinnabarinus TaxID=5643 RepID=A0A060S7W2_PYCCI|nr:hypothetical protein BN946_scf184656.g7 [Trametes cinnabarina]